MTPVEFPIQHATLCFQSAAYVLWRAATYFCCSAEKILISFSIGSTGRSPFTENQVLLGTNSLLLNIKTLLR